MAGRAKRQVGVGVADYGRDRGARWWGACGFHLLATQTDGDTELSRADAVARGPSLRCCLPRPRSRAVPVLLCRSPYSDACSDCASRDARTSPVCGRHRRKPPDWFAARERPKLCTSLVGDTDALGV